jgi:hypothetical protein
MTYADYEFYHDTFYGQAIAETDFPRLALRASQYLDYFTQGKAAKNPEIEGLKMACCALAEQYQIIDAARRTTTTAALSGAENATETLKSESVGSWSQSYQSGSQTADEALALLKNSTSTLATVARQYLCTTGLLYRGRCPR